MNTRLTPTQIDEIFEAAEHVDVPVMQLLDAAAEIRETLLGASGDISLLPDAPDAPAALRPLVSPVSAHAASLRRARRIRTALVAAALACATLLSAAIAGALPAPLQRPIAEVAQLVGIDLPNANATPTAESPGGAKVTANNSPAPGGSTSKAAEAVDTTVTSPTTSGTEESTPATNGEPGPAAASGHAYAYGQDPGVPGNGNAYGQDPSNPGLGPPENPGNPGLGPPDDPGRGNGNGPPAPPGTGNGNNPDGPGA